MRNAIDFSSWAAVLTTLLGIVVVSLVAVGIRLLLMHGVQLRRERQNRQINERLKTLIAAYKTLGGSFTGDLSVDPSHLRGMRRTAQTADAAPAHAEAAAAATPEAHDDADRPGRTGSDRRRRIRDAVEAALSDVILLGTEQQVLLAAEAARAMVEGRSIETSELVLSLRNFIRDVLDLEAIAGDIAIPKQGPLRAIGSGGRDKAGGAGGGKGGGGGGAGGQAGGGGGGGQGVGLPIDLADDAPHAGTGH